MQTQDASSDLLFKLWPWLEANKKRLIIGGVLVGLAIAAFSYVSAQKEQNETAAGEELTKLLTSSAASASAPQLADAFSKLAAKYPGTAAAERAQLQAGSTLFASGQYAEAGTQFQKYLSSDNSGGALAASAQLGVAACLEALGKPEALAAYQKVAANFATTTSGEVAKQAVVRLTPKTATAPAPAAATNAPTKS